MSWCNAGNEAMNRNVTNMIKPRNACVAGDDIASIAFGVNAQLVICTISYAAFIHCISYCKTEFSERIYSQSACIRLHS